MLKIMWGRVKQANEMNMNLIIDVLNEIPWYFEIKTTEMNETITEQKIINIKKFFTEKLSGTFFEI